MAERRMFAKTIIDSDAFLDMPTSARLLYFDLGMRADDDGFINAPKKIMRMTGASDDDMRLLIAKKFVIPFENGVVVIKHWKIHNYIRTDRYVETKYKEQKALLKLDENNAYTLDTTCLPVGIPVGIPSVNQVSGNWDTQVRLGKDSIGKDSIDKDILSGNPTVNPPKESVSSEFIKDVIEYLNEKAGTKYQYTSKKTQELIRARMNDLRNLTLDDFKTVIDNQCKAWKGTDMEKYLRPETLFGTKFEGYLNKPKNNGVVTDKYGRQFCAPEQEDILPF